MPPALLSSTRHPNHFGALLPLHSRQFDSQLPNFAIDSQIMGQQLLRLSQ